MAEHVDALLLERDDGGAAFKRALAVLYVVDAVLTRDDAEGDAERADADDDAPDGGWFVPACSRWLPPLSLIHI